MKKSILKSMLVGSATVVLMTFVIMTLVFTRYVETNAIRQKTELLSNNVVRIGEISRVALANQSTNMNIIYRTMIDNISYNLDASVIVFDTDGRIITVSGLSKDKYINHTLKADVYKPVIAGHEVSGTGLLDGLFDGQSMLTVGAPLKSNGEVFAGVFLCQPVPDIKSTYNGMFNEILAMMLLSMFISMILFYVISKKITTPIHRMNEAVNEFAKGDFSRRVEYDERDELGELAANINNMAKSLDNLEKMRSSFVSDVSHELRTPMTSISGFVEGILDGTISDEDRDRYLEIVLSESKRLSRLVTDLLSLSRMENGETTLNITEFDINDLACQALIKFEKQIDEKHLDIETDIPDDRCMVRADKDAITQVLINLLNNAMKFTPDGGKISVRIWTHQIRAYVEIKNTGHGIEKEKLDFIWDRFYKADKSRSMDRSGFGLGLYIVKNIIARHDEKIWADSVVDEYTSFTFSLRLA